MDGIRTDLNGELPLSSNPVDLVVSGVDAANDKAPISGSIVLPAHNEEVRGFRTLPAIRELASMGHVLIVVVCNGCTDRTAELARSVPGVIVRELSTASKQAALNEGDLVADGVFPRLYLDADVDVTAESLLALLGALRDADPHAVGPIVHFQTAPAPRLVRAYFRALETLPFLTSVRRSHLDGRGVYGVNQAGRSRFDAFPPVRGDDTFFDRMFSQDEKATVSTARVGLSVPLTTIGFLRARARSAQGAEETTAWLAMHRPDRLVVSTAQSDPLGSVWSRVVHHHRTSGLVGTASPSSLGALGAFILVEGLARGRATALRAVGRTARWR